LKTGDVKAFVGSNPTPSALTRSSYFFNRRDLE
jgi:hypothetical protein